MGVTTFWGVAWPRAGEGWAKGKLGCGGQGTRGSGSMGASRLRRSQGCAINTLATNMNAYKAISNKLVCVWLHEAEHLTSRTIVLLRLCWKKKKKRQKVNAAEAYVLFILLCQGPHISFIDSNQV